MAAVLCACELVSPAPSAAPAGPTEPGATPVPVIALSAASCASPAAATFSGRGAEVGYIAYRTCKGSARNAGTGRTSVDVWIDGLDAQGRRLGSCRQTVGILEPGASRDWEATCPILAGDVRVSLRATDSEGNALPTAAPR